MKKHSSKGFTLVELMVVVGLVALLSSIVIASLKTARDNAQSAKIKNDIVQIKVALQEYYQDYGYFPACTVGGVFQPDCCIGGTTCTLGPTIINGELTALKFGVNNSSQVSSQLAAAYYNANLGQFSVAYHCDASSDN